MCAYRKVRRVNSGQRRPVRRQSDSYNDESDYPEQHHHQKRPAHSRNYRMQPKSNNTAIIVISIVIVFVLLVGGIFILSNSDNAIKNSITGKTKSNSGDSSTLSKIFSSKKSVNKTMTTLYDNGIIDRLRLGEGLEYKINKYETSIQMNSFTSLLGSDFKISNGNTTGWVPSYGTGFIQTGNDTELNYLGTTLQWDLSDGFIQVYSYEDVSKTDNIVFVSHIVVVKY